MSRPNSNGKYLGTVLITGGNGYIGQFIARSFLAEPTCGEVIIADIAPPKTPIPEVVYKKCDITSKDEVLKLLEEVKPKTIIHMVSPVFYVPWRYHYKLSYLATKQLLEICKRSPHVKAFIYTSSAEAVKHSVSLNSRPQMEQEAEAWSLTRGPTPYCRIKGACDSMTLQANTGSLGHSTQGKAEGFADILFTASIRLTGVYGPGDMLTIGAFRAVAGSIGTRIQFGKNELTHDWLYVESAALAHVCVAKGLLDPKGRSEDLRVDGQAFNISDGKPMPFYDFANRIYKHAGDTSWEDPSRIIVLPMWLPLFVGCLIEWAYWIFTLGFIYPHITYNHFLWQTVGCWLSIEKARTRLGFEPICDTEEGLRRSLKWFEVHDRKDGVKKGI